MHSDMVKEDRRCAECGAVKDAFKDSRGRQLRKTGKVQNVKNAVKHG